MNTDIKRFPIWEILRKSQSAVLAVGLFSFAINILMLTGPLFMLQVYDRVLTSRSVPTLIVLFGLVAGLYIFLGVFEFFRSRILSRIGYRIDVELMTETNKTWLQSSVQHKTNLSKPISDLTSVRQFFLGNGLPALFDIPWVPVYLTIVYLLHTWLGLLATAGAVIVIMATIFGELFTKHPIRESVKWELSDAKFSERGYRSAEAVISMGMLSNVTQFWTGIRRKSLGYSQISNGRSGFISTTIKSTRMLLQSSILALGAYLAIYQEISPGTMIAASILGGRALAPVDAAVGNWKSFIKARQAYARLSSMLSCDTQPKQTTQLPAPKGFLSVKNLIKFNSAKAGTADQKAILQNINFSLEPGDGLGVIGASASGKSSLARIIVGLWVPDKGSVRLDDALFSQWDRDELGKYIGYLPQSVELIDGTIRQNISRFATDAQDENIIHAAKLAGVHELILELPNGYSSDLRDGQTILSGGQSQRIALARAVYGTPILVVLDEPNASLDAEGDAALTRTILTLRKQGAVVIVMAHRPSAIAAVNKILVLNKGQQMEFGEKQTVLDKVTKKPNPPLPVLRTANDQ